MEEYFNKIQQAKNYIEGEWKKPFPSTFIVSGTGLSPIVEGLEPLIEIPYEDIPNFPKSTVQSHPGKFIIGKLREKLIGVLLGRWHYYEGYSTKEITLPIRVIKEIGAHHVIYTNVAGGVNENYQAGDLVVITDHINLIPDNPLRGPNDNRLGIRFPDMLNTYDKTMIEKIIAKSAELGIKTHKGIYLALAGPSLETPAEYKMIHSLGADLVGMSTVPEVIVAKHSGLMVSAISIVSNVCYPPERLTETTVEEVIEVATLAAGKLNKLLKNII